MIINDDCVRLSQDFFTYMYLLLASNLSKEKRKKKKRKNIRGGFTKKKHPMFMCMKLRHAIFQLKQGIRSRLQLLFTLRERKETNLNKLSIYIHEVHPTTEVSILGLDIINAPLLQCRQEILRCVVCRINDIQSKKCVLKKKKRKKKERKRPDMSAEQWV